jgi:UDP-N-acetylmuramoyl-tripeptide--D-alanyl-D-alanine ligase
MYARAARRAGMRPTRVIEFEDNLPLIEWLQKNLTKGDAVLLKGSHGLRMDRILSELEVQQ